MNVERRPSMSCGRFLPMGERIYERSERENQSAGVGLGRCRNDKERKFISDLIWTPNPVIYTDCWKNGSDWSAAATKPALSRSPTSPPPTPGPCSAVISQGTGGILTIISHTNKRGSGNGKRAKHKSFHFGGGGGGGGGGITGDGYTAEN
ncbi:hypothetical protein GWI33_012532 [Rhynchophorus ferrugineus]|uniref:Uncharacterized protein n=1 Tax=Rhynchophorus ferrugineus TaxID=354439 RepID=A0A834MAT6_RHYFE|nr:hypothetical protein GWI33_012532 [Rhynchophorus ferrugineus]